MWNGECDVSFVLDWDFFGVLLVKLWTVCSTFGVSWDLSLFLDYMYGLLFAYLSSLTAIALGGSCPNLESLNSPTGDLKPRFQRSSGRYARDLPNFK